MAKASRIYVEGKHDAELVEKIWGDDLRDVGVVVEFLNGIDDLPAIAAEFAAVGGRRLGVLVDHLVDGLEGEPDRGAGDIRARPRRRPSRTSTSGPRSSPRVVGISALAAGAARSAVEGGRARGHRLASRIRPPPGGASSAGCAPTPTWSRPSSGRVEELIDFVTAPGSR